MNKDLILVGSKATLRNFLHLIQALSVRQVVVETDYTINYFELLSASCGDRGCFRWIAETKQCAYLDGMKDPRAGKAHIDNADLFPRLYFYPESVAKEFGAWCAVRDQDIQMIKVPVEYSPQFDADFYMEVIGKILEGEK